MLVSLNPFNVSRFMFVGSWFPVLIALGGKYARYWVVYSILFLGVVVVMPVMSVTSRAGVEGLSFFKDSGYAQEAFILKDIDLIDTLAHGVRLTDEDGYLWGDNTLASALFFVPRKFWEEKPIVGGLRVGEDLWRNYGAGTPNLSYYFGGDLYMDFGFVGVVLGFLGLGMALFFLGRFGGEVEGVRIGDLVVAGSVPILVRGPVGAVIGYFVCLLLAVFIYRLFFKVAR